MKTKRLFNRLAATLTDNRETLGNEKGGGGHQTFFLLTPLPQEKAETFGDTKGDVKAKLLVQTLPDNLRPVNAKIKTDTQKAI